ncbi:MAG: 2Fe-2S iron-sulfur cluster binding domain-containing protein [Firmicutes bacterium]|jgi:Na+-transporting NADH:ubiquinone oxidoreductase subunit F|nr:2Fe-2S iron-sulfur cluster binding domain-containing protein [Bacillota bacterium]
MNTVFLTTITISLIASFLALLLSIANKTIANYGEKTVTINDEKDLIVTGGETLLSSLIENEVFIPSACGGKGSCGYCKVKVLEGGGNILATEKGYVSPDEEKEGIRLSCQLKVKEDLKIEIPKELLSVKQFNVSVDMMADVTSTIKHLRLGFAKDDEISFSPGQYVQILTPKYKGNKEEVYRAYSIASSPHIKNSIELLIGYVENGVCTTYIHNYLKTDDKLTIIGPFGDFYYHDGTNEMIMVAIGTGMAPILSILDHMVNEKIDRPVKFFFSARTRDELFLLDKIEMYKEKLPNFQFICSLSRCKDPSSWEGDLGRVTDTIEKYIENGLDKEAYLCGNPKMINSVVEKLLSKGLSEDLIFYDKFE